MEVSQKAFANMEKQAKNANENLKARLNDQFEQLGENLGNEYQNAEESYK